MSGVATRAAGPVDEYVAALATALHGPERAKTLMLQEIRDGLLDATAAHTAAGENHERAARQAVQEFGTVGDLVPGCQRELTIAQTRRTAGALSVAATLLLGYAHLVWVTAGDQSPAWRILSAGLAAVAVGAGLAATSALAATGVVARRLAAIGVLARRLAATAALARRRPAAGVLSRRLTATAALARRLSAPGGMPAAIAWTGTATSAAMAIGAVGLAAISAFTAHWPLTVVGGVLAAASHAGLAGSARACRRCTALLPS